MRLWVHACAAPFSRPLPPARNAQCAAAVTRGWIFRHAPREPWHRGIATPTVDAPLVQGRCVGATRKPPLRPSSWFKMKDLPCIAGSTGNSAQRRETAGSVAAHTVCARCVPRAAAAELGSRLRLTWRALPHTATTPTGPRVLLSTASASWPSSNLPVAWSYRISSSGTPWPLAGCAAAAGEAAGGVARLPNQPLIRSRLCPPPCALSNSRRAPESDQKAPGGPHAPGARRKAPSAPTAAAPPAQGHWH